RAKDVIKSGGEWISSVELENAIIGHPAVLEAAVIGLPHQRWQERPLACVVPKPGQTITREELLAGLAPRVAKWWLPDDVVFLETLPKTRGGKLGRRELRERLAGHPGRERWYRGGERRGASPRAPRAPAAYGGTLHAGGARAPRPASGGGSRPRPP